MPESKQRGAHKSLPPNAEESSYRSAGLIGKPLDERTDFNGLADGRVAVRAVALRRWAV